MATQNINILGADKGDRRVGLERRQFSYSEHIPERRSGKDRREGKDRRNRTNHRLEAVIHMKTERRSKPQSSRII